MPRVIMTKIPTFLEAFVLTNIPGYQLKSWKPEHNIRI